jgi:hypothetical protein
MCQTQASVQSAAQTLLAQHLHPSPCCQHQHLPRLCPPVLLPQTQQPCLTSAHLPLPRLLLHRPRLQPARQQSGLTQRV